MDPEADGLAATFQKLLPVPKVRRLLGRRAMWAVIAGNVMATPLYFAVTSFFVETFFRWGDSYSWLAIVLGVTVAGVVVAAWRRDRAVGATIQVPLLLLPFVLSLPPPPLRAWRAFEPAVLVDGRALLAVLFVVLAPGGLLAFTMVSIKRWVVADRGDHRC